jgi:hypothetical protein
VTVEKGSGGYRGVELFAAEHAVDGFADFVDGFADRRIGTGDAVDDPFGDFGDAGAANHAAGCFIDAGDRFVDGAGGRA